MVIVDTTVWIDYLRGTDTPEADWLDQQSSVRRIGLLDLMLCEILQGLPTDAEAERVLSVLRRCQIEQTGGVDLAVSAARNYRSLRARDRTVRRTIDCLIATFCIEHGHALLHADRDFDSFEQFLGLQVVRVGGAAPAPKQ